MAQVLLVDQVLQLMALPMPQVYFGVLSLTVAMQGLLLLMADCLAMDTVMRGHHLATWTLMEFWVTAQVDQ